RGGPPQCEQRPQGGWERGVGHVFVPPQRSRFEIFDVIEPIVSCCFFAWLSMRWNTVVLRSLKQCSRLRFRDERLPFCIIVAELILRWPVPCRDLVAPPELARNAP